MDPVKNILFVINPISGIGKKNRIPALIEKHLSGKGFNPEIRYTKYRGHGHKIARSEHENYDAIVAVGGDGSVNEVGSALVHTNCALGIIPSGSGNGFARYLNVPLDAEKALQRITQFNINQLDSGEVNGNVFLGTCGFGFDAHIAKKFDEYHKRGFASYVKLVIQEYGKYRPPKFSISIGGKIIDDDYAMCSVANADQFGNGFVISPNSDGQDGVMELILIRRFSMVSAAAVVPRFFNRSIHKSKYFESIPFSEKITIRIDDDKEVIYHLDGEPFLGGPEFMLKLHNFSLKLI